METLKARLAAFQASGLGQFLKKFGDDKATNLATLLAWGTLTTFLPLLLGILGIAGLVLRDPATLDKVYGTLVGVIPQEAAVPLGAALDAVRKDAAAPAGIVGLVLLLYNGSSFFANMESVFNQAFHVPSRNFVTQRLVAVAMLVVCGVLLVVSTVALGAGGLIGYIPVALPFGPLVGTAISWSISILSAILLFLTLYVVLPNIHQGWRDALPGTLAATVLFFAITQVFPLYLAFFPPNQAYAVFGMFLVLTFWLYLLGIVFVLGAEVNAFLQQPSRSVAMADAQERAQTGRAEVEVEPRVVKARATGSAPKMRGSHPSSGQPTGAATLFAESATGRSGRDAGIAGSENVAGRPTLAGKLLGFVGLVIAAVLLRGRGGSDSASATGHA